MIIYINNNNMLDIKYKRYKIIDILRYIIESVNIYVNIIHIKKHI